MKGKPLWITQLKHPAKNGLPMYRVAYEDGVAICRADMLDPLEKELLQRTTNPVTQHTP